MTLRTIRLPLALTAALAVNAVACDYNIPLQEFEELQPRGVIEGQIIYQGPAPCTKDGHVLGAAVLYLWSSDGLPPPETFSPSLENFNAVSGDVLFADTVELLPFNANGDLACPPPGTPSVVASANFVISPVSAGSFQIRAFYDLDGDFFPTFTYANLPTKGDVSGGSLANLDGFFAGEPPVFKNILVGELGADGAYHVPSKGVHLENVAVGLGQPYPLQRPYLHYAGVTDDLYGNTDPSNIVMPADHWADDFSSFSGVESSLIRIRFDAGVPELERASAMAPPFGMHLDDPGMLMVYRFDFNGDGVVDGNDSVPESALVPALMPLMIWTKTEASDPTHSTTQGSPTVIDLGMTFAFDSLIGSAGLASHDPVPFDHITVAARPATICIDSSVSPPMVALVTPKEKDRKGGYIFGEDTGALKGALAGLTGTVPENVEILYTCMPMGHYGLNVIYTTGQVWSLPNEAGYCMAREEPTKGPDGTVTECGDRARLPSQAATLQIGPPAHEAADCYAFANDALRDRFRTNCLTADERAKFDRGELY